MRELHHPSRSELSLSNVLHALSDLTRLDIVRQLSKIPEQCMGNCDTKVAKSTMSHHFKILREAGVTRTRIDGVQRFVSLRQDDLDARFPGLMDVLLRVSGHKR